MTPPISDLLRSRGGQSRSTPTTTGSNIDKDVLPLHSTGGGSSNGNFNQNNNNNTNGKSPNVNNKSNISSNSFLLGGMYVPNKDKRRQLIRRRVVGGLNNKNGNFSSFVISICQNVLIRYTFIVFVLFMSGMIISQHQQRRFGEKMLGHTPVFQQQQQRRSTTNHKYSSSSSNIDRLLQDPKLLHRLPSIQVEKDRLIQVTRSRYAYQQQQHLQQKRNTLLELLIPEWYHRNEPIKIIQTTTTTTTLGKSDTKKEENNDNINSNNINPNDNNAVPKLKNHDTINNKEMGGDTEWDGNSILLNDNIIHIRSSSSSSSGRIRRTLQNNIHNMTQYSDITSVSCPHNLLPTNISVSLLIQSSIDRLWILQETCQRWKAPIIVVVAVSDDNDPNNNNTTTVLQNYMIQWKQNCTQLKMIVYHLDDDDTTPDSYPVNTLRNIALDAVSTSHILMIDIDFIPSQQLDIMIQSALIEQEQQNQQHLATSTSDPVGINHDRTAMVIPAFDRVLHPPCTTSIECEQHLRTNSNFIPSNFHSLQQCYKNDECIIFQSMDNWDGHSSTRTELWLQQRWYTIEDNDINENISKGERRIRSIPCFDSLRYEPYVVLRWCPSSSPSSNDNLSKSSTTTTTTTTTTSNNDVIIPVAPYYDERFHGYGKNKIQLISHLRLMGYQFMVLPKGGFIVHNPHIASSAKTIWNNIHDHTLHRSMDILYQTFLNELVSIYLIGVQHGGTEPKNIISSCPTEDNSSK